VWTLSWNDVQSVLKKQGDYATETLLPEKMPGGLEMYNKALGGVGAALQPYKSSTMELLMSYLENPDAERLFGTHARAYALSLLNMASFRNSTSFAKWNQKAAEIAGEIGVADIPSEFGNTFFGEWKPRAQNSHLTVYSGAEVDDMQKNKNNAAISVFALLDDNTDGRTDRYEAEWNGFWQFANVMQFLDGFAAVSAVGLEKNVYAALPTEVLREDVPLTREVDGAAVPVSWREVLAQNDDESILAFAEKCIALGAPAPSSVGFELVGGDGRVVGEAELAWEGTKTALLMPWQDESEAAFLAAGWRVVRVNDEITQSLFEGDSHNG
jgi:DEAD/DEAH box helicase domain-containing protein